MKKQLKYYLFTFPVVLFLTGCTGCPCVTELKITPTGSWAGAKISFDFDMKFGGCQICNDIDKANLNDLEKSLSQQLIDALSGYPDKYTLPVSQNKQKGVANSMAAARFAYCPHEDNARLVVPYPDVAPGTQQDVKTIESKIAISTTNYFSQLALIQMPNHSGEFGLMSIEPQGKPKITINTDKVKSAAKKIFVQQFFLKK